MMDAKQVIQAVKWVGWWMYNTGWDDFAEVMRSHGIIREEGIQEQWDAMHFSPMRWFLNIDSELQEKIARAALARYQK